MDHEASQSVDQDVQDGARYGQDLDSEGLDKMINGESALHSVVKTRTRTWGRLAENDSAMESVWNIAAVCRHESGGRRLPLLDHDRGTRKAVRRHSCAPHHISGFPPVSASTCRRRYSRRLSMGQRQLH